DRVNVIKFGETPRERQVGDYLVEHYLPHEKLRTLHVVDTPGTNSQVLQHAEITENYVPRCDLVMFATSADRPFSESERQFLEIISKGWSKKILFVLTKVDIKEPEEIEEILGYVRDSCMKAFSFEPKIFPLSAKKAFKAKAANDKEAYEASGFGALERYLFEELNASERLTLKLHSPLDAALSICKTAESELGLEAENMRHYREARDTIDRQLRQAEVDLKDNVQRFLLEVDNVLHDMETRGRNWLDDNVKLRNFGLLRDGERFRNAFEVSVSRDFEHQIQEVIQKACDWMVKTHLKTFQDIMEYYDASTKAATLKNMVGSVDRKFKYDREKLVDDVRNQARDRIKDFDREATIRRMQARISDALVTMMGISVIGIGGGLLTSFILAAAFDPTGVLIGVAVAGASAMLLPWRRATMKSEFSKRMAELRKKLQESLRAQFDREAAHIVDGVRTDLKPFYDLCSRETEVIEASQKAVEGIRKELIEVKNEVAALL
ncbi:MAG: dynamin family protein, partial [Planctomycetes bacterium]|nr:dynamin family protein [Planctomycetota bacterium]